MAILTIFQRNTALKYRRIRKINLELATNDLSTPKQFPAHLNSKNLLKNWTIELRIWFFQVEVKKLELQLDKFDQLK